MDGSVMEQHNSLPSDDEAAFAPPAAAAQFHSRELDASSTPSIHTFTRANVLKPSRIDLPSSTSLATFQPQTQGQKLNVTPPVRRKPLPPGSSVASPSSAKTASPVGAKGNTTASPTGNESSSQNKRLKSPPPAEPRIPWLPPQSSPPKLILRDLDQFPRGLSPLIPQSPGRSAFPNLTPDQARKALQDLDSNGYMPEEPDYVRTVKLQPPRPPDTPQLKPRELGQQQPLPPKAPKMPFQSRGGPPPLQLQGELGIHTQQPQFHESRNGHKPSMLTSFFGWKPSASSPTAESSPTTTISDRSHSPQLSPHSPSPHSLTSSIKSIPQAIDVPKANAPMRSSYLPHAPQLPAEPSLAVAAQLEEMEQELREISSELAGSIRREIELEDQIDHLQSGEPHPDFNRRTSDYFSDSGTSSIRYPPSDAGGTKAEDLEKKRRKMDQEKAQIRLDFSQRLQDERAKRKILEVHIRTLQEHITGFEQGQHYSTNAPTHELEAALEDSRRRLHEERQLKENFQDLLSALQGDLEKHRNERDNLRDEVVPQLQARVEGLEAEASQFQDLTYEHTRMQQELESLKKENTRLLQDIQRSPRISTIAEEGWSLPANTMKTGLARSASLARGTSSAGGLNKTISLSRSNSLSKERESKESLSERVKEIELQRDALHSALKSLLDRQKYQTREHAKRVKALEQEKERALEAHSPRRKGYENEVRSLRLEVNQLRKRAEDAITQKWQCESGLTGLKKDLDRAEQETGSLRSLLQAHDILIPDFPDRSSQSKEQITSSSLEQAYQELQMAQALTVARLRDLKIDMPTGHEDAKTEETMNQLLKTMTEAERERVSAQREAELFRAQAQSLEESKTFHEGENANLAEQLKASANRVDSLATQVRSQLESNSSLRARLAEAVGRGEKEQKASAMRINQMQGKLKSLEDRLMVAQQHSEDAVQMHEEEVKEIRESDNTQLQRLKNGIRSPVTTNMPSMASVKSPRSPLSPFLLGGGIRSPKGSDRSTGINMRINEALRTEYLEKRVVELESALREADTEMQEVVEKMNKAQICVMDLQNARDDAIRQTKALQAQIQAESAKMGSLMRFMPTSMTSTS